MKLKSLKIICILFSLSLYSIDSYSNSLDAEEELACTAILCLSASGGRPNQCSGALKRYFSIRFKNPLGGLDFRKTLNARKSFLKICPSTGSIGLPESDVDRIAENNMFDVNQINPPTPAPGCEKAGDVLREGEQCR